MDSGRERSDSERKSVAPGAVEKKKSSKKERKSSHHKKSRHKWSPRSPAGHRDEGKKDEKRVDKKEGEKSDKRGHKKEHKKDEDINKKEHKHKKDHYDKKEHKKEKKGHKESSDHRRDERERPWDRDPAAEPRRASRVGDTFSDANDRVLEALPPAAEIDASARSRPGATPSTSSAPALGSTASARAPPAQLPQHNMPTASMNMPTAAEGVPLQEELSRAVQPKAAVQQLGRVAVPTKIVEKRCDLLAPSPLNANASDGSGARGSDKVQKKEKKADEAEVDKKKKKKKHHKHRKHKRKKSSSSSTSSSSSSSSSDDSRSRRGKKSRRDRAGRRDDIKKHTAAAKETSEEVAVDRPTAAPRVTEQSCATTALLPQSNYNNSSAASAASVSASASSRPELISSNNFHQQRQSVMQLDRHGNPTFAATQSNVYASSNVGAPASLAAAPAVGGAPSGFQQIGGATGNLLLPPSSSSSLFRSGQQVTRREFQSTQTQEYWVDLRSVDEKRAEKRQHNRREALIHVENLRMRHGLNERLPPWVTDDREVYEVVVKYPGCPGWTYFEVHCRLCDKKCYPEDTRGNTHRDSALHRKRWEQYLLYGADSMDLKPATGLPPASIWDQGPVTIDGSNFSRVVPTLAVMSDSLSKLSPEQFTAVQQRNVGVMRYQKEDITTGREETIVRAPPPTTGGALMVRGAESRPGGRGPDPARLGSPGLDPEPPGLVCPPAIEQPSRHHPSSSSSSSRGAPQPVEAVSGPQVSADEDAAATAQRGLAIAQQQQMQQGTTTTSGDQLQLFQQGRADMAPTLYAVAGTQNQGLTKEQVLLLFKDRSINDAPPAWCLEEPDVFKIEFKQQPGAHGWFEVKCLLCDKLAWPEDVRGNTHIESREHRKQYQYHVARRRTKEEQEENMETILALAEDPEPDPRAIIAGEAQSAVDEGGRALDTATRARLARVGLNAETGGGGRNRGPPPPAGAPAGVRGPPTAAGPVASSAGGRGLPSRTERRPAAHGAANGLQWGMGLAVAGRAPIAFLDQINEDPTPLDKINTFSAYNQMKRTYNEKSSAVLGRDLDVEYERNGTLDYCQSTAQKRSNIFTGSYVNEGRGRHSSGATTYASAKTHKLKSNRSDAWNANAQSRGGPAPSAYPNAFDDRESIYSMATISCNSLINKAGRPSLAYQDHQNLSSLSRKGPTPGGRGGDYKTRYVHHCNGPEDSIAGRQPPFEWVIYKPDKDDAQAGSGLKLWCLLCECSPQNPADKGVNHTDDGPQYHKKRLDYYSHSTQDDIVKKRWGVISKFSPPSWQQHWTTDDAAHYRAQGHLAVYGTLWPEEQFAVRMALGFGWRCCLNYIEQGRYSLQEIMANHFKYNEADAQRMFHIYKDIAFSPPPGNWTNYLNQSDRMTDPDSEREQDMKDADELLEMKRIEEEEESGNESSGGSAVSCKAGKRPERVLDRVQRAPPRTREQPSASASRREEEREATRAAQQQSNEDSRSSRTADAAGGAGLRGGGSRAGGRSGSSQRLSASALASRIQEDPPARPR